MHVDPRTLPIYDVERPLLDAVSAHGRVVVQAPTGSGKSTQIPQMLARAGLLREGQAVVLQPRRIAARLLARRVAEEMDVPLGAEVGYQVRLESRVSRSTIIRFVTEGILLRQMVADPQLRGVSVVVFDEFHERHLYGDITLGRALQLQCTTRPDLRIIVMSATLETERLKTYLQPCAQVTSQGRTYPVDVRYLEKSVDFEKTPPWDVAATLTERALASGGIEGDALVFMPGAYEISRTCEALRLRLGARDFDILPLHGELPPADQDRAVADSERRKIIVATNVAETSLTIPGVRLVVDAGLARIARFDPHRGIDTLLIEKISQASSEQRAGRAGRTAPGVCLRLWTEREHAHRPVAELPEIKRRDLAEVLLTLKAADIVDAVNFPWLEPPDPKALARAEQLLTDLGALDATNGAITEVGRQMLAFPAHPRYARMLVEAGRLGCVHDVALIAALTQGRSILLKSTGREMDDAREAALGEETVSDFFVVLAALRYAEERNFDVDACRRLGIHAQGARLVRPLARQFLDLAENSGLRLEDAPARREAIVRCVLAGFADQVARRLDAGTLRCELVHGRRGMLARESVVQKAPLLVAAEISEIGGRGGDVTTILTLCTAIDEALLADMFPGSLRTEDTALLDTQAKRVMVRRRKVFRDLVLEDREAGEVSTDAATKILVQEILDGRCPLPQWDESVDHWIARVNLLAKLFPEYGVTPITPEDKPTLLEQLVHGARSFREVRDCDLWRTLKDWLAPEQLAALERMLPEKLDMPNGRRAKITYTRDGGATISARIQELFGVEKNIVIAQGRLPLRMEILAPNHRPLQVTDDLTRFWQVTYPEIKPALSRRYPRHEWR
ncbi:MAG: ATP-dependent helicase HrpB [Opitutaceae bacterium]|nr:ATP-dependent helicase HrpB [Opitutaceae bacterium]